MAVRKEVREWSKGVQEAKAQEYESREGSSEGKEVHLKKDI
jgi:hypothetical protein